MGVPFSVLQMRNPRLREAEELTSSHTDNESKTWTTKCEILSYLLNLCLVPRAAERVIHRPGELCMTYGLVCRFDWVLGSGWIEPDAIWGLGRVAEWKIDVSGDHSQGLCEGCTYVLPRDTCLRGWEVLSPTSTLLMRLGLWRAVATLGMGTIFSPAGTEWVATQCLLISHPPGQYSVSTKNMQSQEVGMKKVEKGTETHSLATGVQRKVAIKQNILERRIKGN